MHIFWNWTICILGQWFNPFFWQIVRIRVKTRSYTILVAFRHIKRGKALLPVDVREAFQGWGWGRDMMFLSRSLPRLPVT